MIVSEVDGKADAYRGNHRWHEAIFNINIRFYDILFKAYVNPCDNRVNAYLYSVESFICGKHPWIVPAPIVKDPLNLGFSAVPTVSQLTSRGPFAERFSGDPSGMKALAMVPVKGGPENGDDAPENRTLNNKSGHSQPVSEAGYRWECPYCGMERVNTMSEEGRNALRALKSHILLTDGNGHGGTGSFPDENTEDELLQYVTPVDD